MASFTVSYQDKEITVEEPDSFSAVRKHAIPDLTHNFPPDAYKVVVIHQSEDQQGKIEEYSIITRTRYGGNFIGFK